MDYNNIITGEKIQQLADVYLGIDGDFDSNPLIQQQYNKHLNIFDINTTFDNPYLIFCYTHNIDLLATKIHLFNNKFILISHNSDGYISETQNIIHILKYPKLYKWYCQNLCFNHEKLFFIPIGIANSQWVHGDPRIFLNLSNDLQIKNKKVYFNFNIITNIPKRESCYNMLKDKLEWLENVKPINNIARLSEYEFCICPEGHGPDTHRLWEALYVKTVPIVIDSDFTKTLIRNNVPLVVLNSWDELNIDQLNYTNYDFNNINLQSIMQFDRLSLYIKS